MTLPVGPADHASAPSAEQIAAREQDWVRRIQAGDPEAFEAMVRTYADRLFRYAYTYVNSRDTAEEIVQDLFLRLWSQRETWILHGSLLSYLFQAVRNRAVSALRSARIERRFRERALLGDDASALSVRPVPTDESVGVNELSAAVDRAIAALPQRCREVFILSREQQLTYREIAEVLQISVKTVEVHMGRALAILRATLSSWNR